jgi:hypothetical protein
MEEMKAMSNIAMTTTKWLVGLAAVLSVSCNLRPGSGDTELVGTQRNGKRTPTMSGGGPEVVEQWATSAAAGAGSAAATTQLQSLMGAAPGAQLLFVSCETMPCVARVRASSLAEARTLLQAISAQYAGRIKFTARQEIGAYTGPSLQVDVALGTDDVRAVPEAEDELLIDGS